MKILIAEDDKDMRKILLLYFEKEGYEVSTAQNGKIALDLLFNTSYDLAILDWMMPEMDGIEVCQEIKKMNIPTKVLLLTAKTQTEDEIQGLKNGADEYIRKPFEPQVLLLRVKKLLNINQILTCNLLSLNIETKKVTKAGIELNLNKKEYDLLVLFLQNQGNILSREIILNKVWGMNYYGDDRTIDTHIKRLRAKIGNEYISTYRGLGYCMEKQK